MKTKLIQFTVICIILTFANGATVTGSQKTIKLLKPDVNGGIPLMQALYKRHSSRSFSDTALPDRVLSDLIWAAYGINRDDSGKRTAPSALNRQEIDVYVAMKDGVYLYNAKKHQLDIVSDKDIRVLTGKQGFVNDACLNLVYVADMDKSAGDSVDEKLIYAGASAGFIGQNVYLYCASEGLDTVIRAYIDRDQLGKALKLKPNQRIILAQTVGYPGK
ncbi:MAG TPA: SagB/ThcOx family dehydrogenase [Spirochaetota bacterium]|nr:SagB/ThcOx family dehydrogenase [Spirochaetota bacterium]